VSSVIKPVGPEEPSTYWRRRALVVVALLVVLWLFWLLIDVALGGGDEPTAEGPSPTPSFGLTMTPDPDGSPAASEGASASPSASASASPSPSPSASGPCADSDISVTVATSDSSPSVGAGMTLSLNIENTGSTACTRDVGAGANEVRITSGSVLVWSSDFCNTSDASNVVTLAPGQGVTTSVDWAGTITTEGCPADQPTAQAGSYRAIGRNGSVESEPVSFTVQ
jgi:hypothetical protein